MKVYSANPAAHSNTKLIVCCVLSAAVAATVAVLIVSKNSVPTREPTGNHTQIQPPEKAEKTTNTKIEPPTVSDKTAEVPSVPVPPAPPPPIVLQVIPADFDTKLQQRLQLRGAILVSGPVITLDLKTPSGWHESWHIDKGRSFSLYCDLPSAPTPELLEQARHMWKETIEGLLTDKDIRSGQACLDEAFGKAAPKQEARSQWRFGGMFEIQASMIAPDAPPRPTPVANWAFTISTRSPPRM